MHPDPSVFYNHNKVNTVGHLAQDNTLSFYKVTLYDRGGVF